MADRLKFWLLFLALALLAAVAFALLVWLTGQRPEGLVLYAAALAIVFVGLLALAWGVLDIYLVGPLAAFQRSIELMLHANPGHRIEEPPPFLDRLGQGINDLGSELQTARTELLQAVAAAAARSESDKARLEAILIDLGEGVLVCSREGRILLYNQSAARLLRPAGEIGLGRSLYGLLSREPIEHARRRLDHRPKTSEASAARPEVSAAFVCGTIRGGHLLEGRLSLVPPSGAGGESGGFVVSITDVTDEVARQGRLDEVLRSATEGLRRPLANLRAAAESVADFPEMPTAQRAAFERVILEESNDMSNRLEAAAGRFEALARRPWPLTEVRSTDLLEGVIARLTENGGPKATMIGAPQWLSADSHALMLALEFLVRRIQEIRACDAFDLEATAEGRHCFLDIHWQGEPLSGREIEDWMDQQPEFAPGGPTLGDTLKRNGASEIWSEARRHGRAILRLPVSAASQTGHTGETVAPVEPLPDRPEFYDFELLHRPLHDADRSRSLRSLIYVVFDTETTGLKPSQGDEIVSIAGVRVVNGRLITGETFERLVNPGRPIPQASLRFHGIDDDMVADMPPLSVVLPQFHAFAQDAVLVAHNAAFDLKFLQLKESSAGVRFENPVLDTLLLSAYLHRQLPEHSLDAIAHRLGVTVQDRHTALGDAIATAQIFVRLLDLLEASGVTTLAQAIEAGDSIVKVRQMQREF
ncbi:MAG: histidine kinase [Rhodospirillaceae bacterium]|nr:histidine kinase [Rhodospirillaceae bacterium]MDP6622834.1 exonuclease domain-containing protein [Alphaproteobacteria bacterium]